MGFIGCCVEMLSKFIKLCIKAIVILSFRWIISLVLSLILHAFIHYYIFPASEVYSFPAYFTYDSCNPKEVDYNKHSVRCSFLKANINLQGPTRDSLLRQEVEYAFEIILQLPDKLNDNVGMFVVCLQLLNEDGHSTFNPWGDIKPPSSQRNQLPDVDIGKEIQEMKNQVESYNESCRSTILLPTKKQHLSRAEYFSILADPFGLFRTTKTSNEDTIPSVRVRMNGKTQKDITHAVGWAVITVKHANIHIYSARLSITAEIAGFQYLLSLCPFLTGLSWLLFNASCSFVFLYIINFPTLLSNSEKEFIRDFFRISSTTVQTDVNSVEVHPVDVVQVLVNSNNQDTNLYQVPQQMSQTESSRDQDNERNLRDTNIQATVEDIRVSKIGHLEFAEMNMVLDQDMSEFSSNDENTILKSPQERALNKNDNHLARRKKS